MANASPSRLVINVGLMMACNKFLDYTNPAVVNAVRAVYIVVGLFCYMQVQNLVSKLEAAAAAAAAAPATARPVWVPAEKPSGLNAIMAAWKEGSGGAETPAEAPPMKRYDSLIEYELTLARTKASTAIMTAVQPVIFSWMLGIHLVAAMQTVLAPLGLYDDPLTRKYCVGPLLGELPSTEPLYGEQYTDPALDAPFAAAIAGAPASAPALAPAAPAEEAFATLRSGDGEGCKPHAKASKGGALVTTAAVAGAHDAVSAPGAAEGGGLTRDEFASEEAVLGAWEAKDEPVDVGAFRHLVSQGRPIDHRTRLQGWTALMVACGSSVTGAREVGDLLSLGASPLVCDADGWSAFHWAAYHGRVVQAAALIAAFSTAGLTLSAKNVVHAPGGRTTLKRALRLKDVKGRTPLTLALETPGNDEVVALLRAAEEDSGEAE